VGDRIAMQVVLAGFYPPPAGGESVHVWKLSTRLRAAGILKDIVNLRRGAPQSPEYLNGAGPIRLWWVLMRRLSPGTVLHLHTNGHGWKSWTMIVSAGAALRLRRALGVLTLHSGMSPRFLARASRVAAPALRKALAPFVHVVCVNDEIRQALSRLRMPDDRLSVIPAFLGGVAGPLGEDDERMLKALRPLLSVVAGTGPEYGLPALLEALGRLRESYPEIGCVVLGTDGAAGTAAVTARLGLSDRVRFLGPVPHERCLGLVARSTVFIRPSLADGDAVSVREALSLDVPVVASDCAPRPPAVTLFRAGDSADLARKLLSLLQTPLIHRPATPRPDFADQILPLYGRAANESQTRPGLLESPRRAAGSLGREILRFRVSYPIDIVAGAERPESLRYHIYSDRLFLDDLVLDAHGVPLKRYRLLGCHYNPLFVAWWGLYHLERAAREHADRHRDVFLAQLDWLRTNALTRDDGAVVWPCYFDWQEGNARLTAPWISGMYQGVVMSALVRGFRLTGDEKLLELACAGSRVFSRDIGAGGVRSREAGFTLYEEYPAAPLPRVLDGFLFALLGLYDLYAQTGDDGVRRLFTDGVDGLVHHLGWWSYRGKWSWYGSHGYLCPPHYHALNRALLAILHRLTGRPALRDVAEAWRPERLSLRDRIELFVVYTITKNWARVRLPNQRGS